MHPEIGFSELVVILIVAVVAFGPKDLPKLMRTVGEWTRKIRYAGMHMQGIMNATIREAELQELAETKKAVEDIKTKVDGL